MLLYRAVTFKIHILLLSYNMAFSYYHSLKISLRATAYLVKHPTAQALDLHMYQQ